MLPCQIGVEKSAIMKKRVTMVSFIAGRNNILIRNMFY